MTNHEQGWNGVYAPEIVPINRPAAADVALAAVGALSVHRQQATAEAEAFPATPTGADYLG